MKNLYNNRDNIIRAQRPLRRTIADKVFNDIIGWNLSTEAKDKTPICARHITRKAEIDLLRQNIKSIKFYERKINNLKKLSDSFYNPNINGDYSIQDITITDRYIQKSIKRYKRAVANANKHLKQHFFEILGAQIANKSHASSIKTVSDYQQIQKLAKAYVIAKSK